MVVWLPCSLCERKDCSRNFVLCIFSLIIVKSLQFRGCRQIAEPCKYFLCVIVFFGVCFLYFLFLIGWEFWVNSLHNLPSINTMLGTQCESDE